MAFELTGDFGKTVFSSNTDDSGRVSSRYLSLSTEADLNFFKRISVMKTNIVENSMRLYSFLQAGNNNKVRFASLSTPRHLLSSRKSGCTWNPKGRVDMNSNSFDVCPIEYNGEQCPDAFFGSCLEKIYGTGNQVNDIMATPEGRALFSELIQRIYQGLGNSFYDLVWYGQHPLIADADDNEWYKVDDKEWADYKDQQAACGGLMTMIDWMKEEGRENFNVPVFRGDISEDGTTYIGVVTDLLDRIIQAQSGEAKILSKRGGMNGQSGKGVILVTRAIYEKYEQELVSTWNQIPQGFEYYYNGKFCQMAGCDTAMPVPGVLRYKGHWVVCMDEWDEFDHMTGTNTHRAIMTCPGNFGIAYDVDMIDQFMGMGLQITQRLDAPYKGMTFMSTNFKVGTGILDPKFLVNASLTLTPAV